MTKNILISNDDGVLAPGLQALFAAAKNYGNIKVVAPERNCSAASHSLTIESPLRLTKHDNGFMSLDGTPTDCVHFAITGGLNFKPDIVLSGINDGSNLGDDVLYSGTVAAAMEARALGIPAIAVSLINSSDDNYFLTASNVISKILPNIINGPIPANSILNVNVPNVPYEEIKGIKITRLGHRHLAEPVIKSQDPRGKAIYWVGQAGSEQDAGEGTDFHAVNNNYVSITPLQVDLTRYSDMEDLQVWAQQTSI